MKLFSRLTALALTVCLVLGMVPAVQASEENAPGERYINLSVGDALWNCELNPVATAEAMDAVLDLYQEFGFTRIYWRGLQNALWNDVLVVREEAVLYANSIEGNRAWEAAFTAQHGMSPDAYLVSQAHARGMEVYGVTTLVDWGGAADTPINFYPDHHEASFRLENPDWAPKDKYGLMEQGGAIELSYPEARQALIDIHTAEIADVGYDGVAFITYSENFSLKYNDQFGYSDIAVQEYYDRYGLTPGVDAFNRWSGIDEWRRLRGEYLTAFFRELNSALAEDVDIALWVNPRDPYSFQKWNYDQVLVDGIYVDLDTYIQEDIVDQILLDGGSSVSIQLEALEHLIFLTEGYDTEVTIYTSGPNNAAWAPYQQSGVSTLLNFSGAEEMFYDRGSVVAPGENSALCAQLTRIVQGQTVSEVTTADLLAYLGCDSITVQRLALKALVKRGEKSDEITDAIEALLTPQQDSGVVAMAATALKTLGSSDSYLALITCLETDTRYDFSVQEAIIAALGALAATSQEGIIEKYKSYGDTTPENVRVKAVIMRSLRAWGDAASLAWLASEATASYNYAPAGADDLTVTYYNYLRYYAVEAIDNVNSAAAVSTLIGIAGGSDTVISNRAVTSLGAMATMGVMVNDTDSSRTNAVAALDALFAQMGDGSTRADREWAYRPIGEALIALDAGDVLEKYYSQTQDKTLALYAWKCLCMPQTLGAYSEMTEEEYEAAYQLLPDILKDYRITLMSQDFEDASLFSESTANVWVGDVNQTIGRWQAPAVSDGAVAMKTGTTLTGNHYGNPITDGTSYRLSFRVYREADSALEVQIMNADNAYEARVRIDTDGSVMLYDPAAAAFTATDLVIGTDTWAQVTVTASRQTNTQSISVKTNGITQTAQLTMPITPVSGVFKSVFRSRGAAGAVCYVDDVTVSEAYPVGLGSAEAPAPILCDTTVRYDGSAKSIAATADVDVTYTDAAGNAVEAPTDAGVYTATAQLDGVTYAATLTIQKAVPTLDASKVSASGLTYGQILNESALTASEGALTDASGNELAIGELLWQNGTQYVAQTGEFAYTLIPADSNYAAVKGTATVNLAVDEIYTTQTITILSQSFDGLSNTDFAWNGYQYAAGDYYTADGRWFSAIVSSATDGLAAAPLVAGYQGNTGNALKLVRNSNNMTVEMRPGAEDGSNYELRLKLYREADQQLCVYSYTADGTIDAGYYINGTSALLTDWSSGTMKNNISIGFNIPYNEWVELVLTVDRETGTSSFKMIEEDGTVTEAANTAQPSGVSAAITKVFLNPQGTTGTACYVDGISLTAETKVLQEIWNTVVQQDFEDGFGFTLSANSGTANAADSQWVYTNMADLAVDAIQSGVYDNAGNALCLVRDSTSRTLRINTDPIPTGTDYELSFRLYRESYQTMAISLDDGNIDNSELRFLISDYSDLKYLKDGIWTTVLSNAVPTGQWLDFTLAIHRRENTGCVTITGTDGTISSGAIPLESAQAVISSILLAPSPVNAATSANTCYIDDLTLKALDPGYEMAALTVEDTTLSYTGQSQGIAAQALESKITYNGSETVPTAVGSYEVQVLVTQEGYRGAASATLTITPAVPVRAQETLSYIEAAKNSTLNGLTAENPITFIDLEGNVLAGDLVWNFDPAAALTEAGLYGWCFTPADANYESVSGSIYVNVQNADNAVAVMDGVTFADLAMVAEMAGTNGVITLLQDAYTPGLAIDKPLAIDLGGSTLSVGSSGITVSGNGVTLKNGTVTAATSHLLNLIVNTGTLYLSDVALHSSNRILLNNGTASITGSAASEGAIYSGDIGPAANGVLDISGGSFTCEVYDRWCAQGYMPEQAADGTWTVGLMPARIEDQWYKTLQAALDAAQDGQTVTVLTDVTADVITLSKNAVLDLNGHTVTAGGAALFAGQLLDGTDGQGTLVIPKSALLLQSENAQLPLYDTAAGCYRFFDCSVKSFGTQVVEGKVRYYFRPVFANSQAYSLLESSDDAGIALRVKLAWEDVHSEFTFGADLLRAFGNLAQGSLGSNAALILSVRGTEHLDAGTVLTATPTVVSDRGIATQGAPLAYTIPEASQ